jgi:hypothetical protein
LEKMGDFRQASLAAHGSRYSGPGIYDGVSGVRLASSSPRHGADMDSRCVVRNGFAG